MEILETKERKMNKIKREERENLHTFSDTTECLGSNDRFGLKLILVLAFNLICIQ